MAKVQVNLEGLSDEQIELVNRFIAILRKAQAQAQVRTELQKLWQQWSDKVLPLSEQEVEQLAEEAVSHARKGL